MTIEKYASENGFTKLTNTNHPKDNQTVQILGYKVVGEFGTEKVKWSFDGETHSYQWITHEFNKGIMITTLEYWKPI